MKVFSFGIRWVTCVNKESGHFVAPAIDFLAEIDLEIPFSGAFGGSPYWCEPRKKSEPASRLGVRFGFSASSTCPVSGTMRRNQCEEG